MVAHDDLFRMSAGGGGAGKNSSNNPCCDMTNDSPVPAPPTFRDLALPEPLLKALTDVGYEAPSPIQAQTIPHLLEGRDALGMAQTGTGKTAAFALPILARIDLKKSAPQALV